jgi:quercetin dioxygenase-like cupin family protein
MALVELDDLRELELAPGVTARAVHTGNVTVAHVTLRAGATVPEHAHHHEQIVNVIEGEMELTVAGETQLLARGRVVLLPPMVAHSARAVTECHVLDIFHPVRDDFRAMAEGGPAPRPYHKS